ncbi:MAG TPA: methytransferase partner Trm112 [Dehalococcoidia bacterium]|nr:methytransferase partner Trm112 [Dehalococcoidia bacterium]
MRKDMMEILVCPVCKGTLTLTVVKEDGDEVIEGSLFCAKCNETYPISDTIPNLLPPDLRRAMEAGHTA